MTTQKEMKEEAPFHLRWTLCSLMGVPVGRATACFPLAASHTDTLFLVVDLTYTLLI